MTTKNWNLSEKIREIDSEASGWNDDIKEQLVIPKEDVREFIKRLKKEIDNAYNFSSGAVLERNRIKKRIDKLSGEELTK